MGRALKILAYAVILFLTYLVITAGLKSCNNDKKEVASAEVDNTAEETDLYEDDYFEDGTEEDEEDFFGKASEEDINYDEIDKALADKEKDKKSSPPSTPSSQVDYTTPPKPSGQTSYNNGNSSGNYMVIAGSYIINTNAENMVLKLKRMGYNNAEIVVFDQSQYHTVVASRSTSYDQALSSANGLKSQGIDSYVHTKKD